MSPTNERRFWRVADPVIGFAVGVYICWKAAQGFVAHHRRGHHAP